MISVLAASLASCGGDASSPATEPAEPLLDVPACLERTERVGPLLGWLCEEPATFCGEGGICCRR